MGFPLLDIKGEIQMKKRTIELILGLLMALSLCACGGTSPETSSNVDQKVEAPIKISESDKEELSNRISEMSAGELKLSDVTQLKKDGKTYYAIDIKGEFIDLGRIILEGDMIFIEYEGSPASVRDVFYEILRIVGMDSNSIENIGDKIFGVESGNYRVYDKNPYRFMVSYSWNSRFISIADGDHYKDYEDGTYIDQAIEGND